MVVSIAYDNITIRVNENIENTRDLLAKTVVTKVKAAIKSLKIS